VPVVRPVYTKHGLHVMLVSYDPIRNVVCIYNTGLSLNKRGMFRVNRPLG
jgi:hypothetical protein